MKNSYTLTGMATMKTTDNPNAKDKANVHCFGDCKMCNDLGNWQFTIKFN